LKVFIDISAFCALAIPKDQHNFKAKSLYRQIQQDKAGIYTSDYVLDEVYTLLKTRSSYSTAIKFMNQIDKLSRETTEPRADSLKSYLKHCQTNGIVDVWTGHLTVC
jgi:predicted nucleic acid-binding protein